MQEISAIFRINRNRILFLLLAASWALPGCGGGGGGTASANPGVSGSNPSAGAAASIQDLAVTTVTSYSAGLTWKAPTPPNLSDPVASYDIRYSTSPITDNNWSIATQVTGEPTPEAAGTTQSKTVTGLSPQTTYHFAIRSVEASGAISSISNVVNTATTAPVYSNSIHLAACGELTQPNTTYTLDADVRSEGTCFQIKAKNVSLDLNGHTVLYDDFPGSGLANADFENGTGSVPTGWDLSQAPTAGRLSTSSYALVNQWYFTFNNAADGSRIVSEWASLPPSTKAAVYFIRGDKLWAYQQIPVWNLKVVAEDGTTVLDNNFTQDQIFIFTSRPVATRYRTILTLQNSYGLTFNSVYGVYPSFDLFDLRPVENYGVVNQYQDNVSIRNGRIVQGRGKSLYGHGVFVYGANNVVVEELAIDSSGMEASSVNVNYGTTVKVDNCTITNQTPYIFNRMQLSAALMVNSSSGILITNNRIQSGSGWGGILASNKDLEIAYNNVITRSAVTNHHGIATAGTGAMISPTNAKIHHNVIDADPGQGILSAPSGGEIYANQITIRKTAPNFEYGYISFDGITVKDYGNRWCNNLRVYDNRITLYGEYDKYYTGYASGNKVVNGIMNMCTGTNVAYDNNTITGRSVDLDVYVSGIEMGGMNDNLVVFSNNTIDSDVADLVFGGYAGQGDILPNLRFEGNKLIRGPNPNGYHTFGMERSGNINTDKIRFIDSKVQNGASMADVKLPGSYGRFSYTVEWSSSVVAKNAAGGAIPNAQVTFRDVKGTQVFSGITNASGGIDGIVLPQYRHTGMGMTAASAIDYFTPYTVAITEPGGSPITKVFALDGRKTVTYQAGTTITVDPAN